MSSLVVKVVMTVKKPDGNTKVDELLKLGPRHLNSAIGREHYQMPTLDEITSHLAGVKYFPVLDATFGHWDVPPAKDFSLLTTFQTPFGRFCYLRLPFAIC